MAEFTNAPTLTPTTIPSPSLSAATADLLPVQVTVEVAAPDLANVGRPVMLNATPVEIVSARSLSLATVLGDVRVSLPAALPRQVQQDLTRELMSLIDAQKTMTLSLQSGGSGAQGVLLVPMTAATGTQMASSAGTASAAATGMAATGTAAVTQAAAPSGASNNLTQPMPAVQSGRVVTVVPLPPLPQSVAQNVVQNTVQQSMVQQQAGAAMTAGGIAATTSVPAVTTQPALPATTPAPVSLPPSSPVVAAGGETVVRPGNEGGGFAPPIAVSVPAPVAPPEPAILSRANKLYAAAVLPATVSPATVSPTVPPAAPPTVQTQQADMTLPPLRTGGSPPPAQATTEALPISTAQTSPVAAPAAYLSGLYRTLTGVAPQPAAPVPAQTAAPPSPGAELPQAPPDVAQAGRYLSGMVAEPVLTPLTGHDAARAAVQLAAQTPPPHLTVGKEAALRVVSVVPPQAGQTSPALPPLQPGQFAAAVVAQTHDGKMIVQAGETTMFVRDAATAPVGTMLVLQVAGDDGVDLPQVKAMNYTALPQILAAIQQMDVLTAPRLLAGLPQANDSLAGALLMIFGAYKSADPAAWIGRPAAETLANIGKVELLQSLSRDIKEQIRGGSDPVVGDWRSYPVPLFNAGAFQALTLHVHHDKQKQSGDGAAQGREKTRFLIDMRLSKLGDLQLDGFVQAKKIDMILRSERGLPDGLHAELREAYGKAMAAVGFAGALNFQLGRQHWVRVSGDTRGGLVT